MRSILLAAGVAALALGTPVVGQDRGKGGPPAGGPGAQGGGPGQKGGGPGGQARGGPDNSGKGRPRGGPEKADRGGPTGGPRETKPGRGSDRGAPQMRAERPKGGPPADRGPRGSQSAGQPAEKGGRGPEVARKGPDWKGQAPGPEGASEWQDKGPKWKGPRDDARPPAGRFASRRWDGNRYQWAERSYAIPVSYGCPPGLAKRGNGCVPPGRLRQLAPASGWADWYPARYRDDGYDWAYGDGYLYRYDRGGGGDTLGSLISAFVPLLGGALFGGNLWPQQYDDYQVPDYYDRFYGSSYNGNYDYRYADDAIFAVDPGSSRIDSIAGLLTGDSWSVGQPMPVGYDLYNVPLEYRDRYRDGPEHWYRYSDGYVYDVDPTTQLVRAVSELLG